MLKQINPDTVARASKMAIVGQGRNQTEIAHKLGIDRIFLNAYLNRRIDLLPEDIDRLLQELNLKEEAVKLSALAEVFDGYDRATPPCD